MEESAADWRPRWPGFRNRFREIDPDPMDLKIISRLVRIMKRGDLTELELDEEGTRLRLKRSAGEVAAAPSSVVHVLPGAGQAPMAMGAMPAPVAAAAEAPAEPGGYPPGTRTFDSPMVGTLYHSPSPDAEAFVRVGSQIEPETVVCIVEAMKVMNEVQAETSGEIVEVLVENGEPVEYGQPLFLIR